MTVEDWDRVLQVNLSGAFYLSRAILQHMLDRGYGRIIKISSIIGESGNIGQGSNSWHSSASASAVWVETLASRLPLSINDTAEAESPTRSPKASRVRPHSCTDA